MDGSKILKSVDITGTTLLTSFNRRHRKESYKRAEGGELSQHQPTRNTDQPESAFLFTIACDIFPFALATLLLLWEIFAIILHVVYVADLGAAEREDRTELMVFHIVGIVINIVVICTLGVLLFGVLIGAPYSYYPAVASVFLRILYTAVAGGIAILSSNGIIFSVIKPTNNNLATQVVSLCFDLAFHVVSCTIFLAAAVWLHKRSHEGQQIQPGSQLARKETTLPEPQAVNVPSPVVEASKRGGQADLALPSEVPTTTILKNKRYQNQYQVHTKRKRKRLFRKSRKPSTSSRSQKSTRREKTRTSQKSDSRTFYLPVENPKQADVVILPKGNSRTVAKRIAAFLSTSRTRRKKTK